MLEKHCLSRVMVPLAVIVGLILSILFFVTAHRDARSMAGVFIALTAISQVFYLMPASNPTKASMLEKPWSRNRFLVTFIMLAGLITISIWRPPHDEYRLIAYGGLIVASIFFMFRFNSHSVKRDLWIMLALLVGALTFDYWTQPLDPDYSYNWLAHALWALGLVAFLAAVLVYAYFRKPGTPA